jgi:nucleoside-diphosphate kinase
MSTKTLGILKPDGMKRNLLGTVIKRIEEAGLKVTAVKTLWLTEQQVEVFYAEHKGKPFFKELTSFLSSTPVTAMIIEGDDAVGRYRRLMGATDPAKADPGTLRKDLALSMSENTVHGSDSDASAARELSFFFAGYEQ